MKIKQRIKNHINHNNILWNFKKCDEKSFKIIMLVY